MEIRVINNWTESLTGEQWERTWEVYSAAMASMADRAAQRHLLRVDEFTNILHDFRITKHVVLDGAGTPLGIATITNRLDRVDLIEPRYFRRLWPAEYEAEQLWYVLFVAVAPGRQGAYAELIKSMFDQTGGTGLVFMDTCQFNAFEMDLPHRTNELVKRWHPGARVAEVDRQSFWGYDLRPVGELPGH